MTILEAYGTEQDQVIEDAIAKYKAKIVKYGESWKKMSVGYLQRRLGMEILEWKDTPPHESKAEYDELLDIINVASMLAVKLKEQR